MELRVGMSRQQYQRLESKGNPRLDTLELVAKGLKMEVMLIPQEKLRDVKDFLAGTKETSEGFTLAAKGSGLKSSPEALKELPMDDEHKAELREHWRNLHIDVRIEVS